MRCLYRAQRQQDNNQPSHNLYILVAIWQKIQKYLLQ